MLYDVVMTAARRSVTPSLQTASFIKNPSRSARSAVTILNRKRTEELKSQSFLLHSNHAKSHTTVKVSILDLAVKNNSRCTVSLNLS